MTRELVDHTLDEMHKVLVDSAGIKDSYKKKYIERCIDSIKKGPFSPLCCTHKHSN